MPRKSPIILAILLALFAPLQSCQRSTTLSSPNKLPASQNLILYVSNQSFDISSVDIKVMVDGEIFVEDSFKVNNQHNWREFRFQLSSGKHVLEAVSKRGAAELQSEFAITDKHWAALAYWYYPDTHHAPTPRQFTFRIQDEPILFQ